MNLNAGIAAYLNEGTSLAVPDYSQLFIVHINAGIVPSVPERNQPFVAYMKVFVSYFYILY